MNCFLSNYMSECEKYPLFPFYLQPGYVPIKIIDMYIYV